RLPRLGIRHLRNRAPTALRPTAGPSASSARCSQDGPMVRFTATATSAPPPSTAGAGTTTVSEDTQPSATSPRSLVLTREEPTFSGLTPRSHGCAFEAARFADWATTEDNKRSNGRRGTPRPRPTRLGVTETNAKAAPGVSPRRPVDEVDEKPGSSSTQQV